MKICAPLLLAWMLTVPCASAQGVRNHGQGNIGINVMTGGTVTNGLDENRVQALIERSGHAIVKASQATISAEGAKQEAAIRRESARLERRLRAAVPAKVLEAFLTTLLERAIPPERWVDGLVELTRRWGEMKQQIASTPAATQESKALLAKATVAADEGRIEDADKLLDQVVKAAMRRAQPLLEAAQEASREAAHALAARATLAWTQLRREDAAQLYQQAFELRMNDVSDETVGWLLAASDVHEEMGSTSKSAEMCRLALSALGDCDGSSSREGCKLTGAWAFDRLGRVQLAQGDLVGALKSHERSRAIFAKLAAADASNARWQRDLSVSLNQVGDVQAAQGDLVGALKTYEQGHAIFAKLAAADASNAGWQRDLSVSLNKVGDVQAAQGDLVGALKSYEQSCAIFAKVAAADASNAGWQRDLSVSLEKVGGVQAAQGDFVGALRSYERSRAIFAKLAAVDASNAGWQRDLSVSLNKVGDVQAAQGDLVGALKNYEQGRAISAKLAAADASNAGWQRDLSVSLNKVGGVQESQGDLVGALKTYEQGRAILAKLAAADASNAGRQRDLSVSLGNVQRVQAAHAALAAGRPQELRP